MKTEIEEGEVRKVLTAKEEKFCYEYCIDLNATQAAIRAGYSKKTARVIGSQNLSKLYIQSEINQKLSNLKETSGLTALKVLKEHEKIAFSDAGVLRSGWMELKDFEALTPDQKACIQEVSTKVVKKNIGTSDEPEIVDVEYVKLKLYDKQKSLDSISKILGFDAPVKLDVSSTVKPMTKAEAHNYLKKLEEDEFDD